MHADLSASKVAIRILLAAIFARPATNKTLTAYSAVRNKNISVKYSKCNTVQCIPVFYQLRGNKLSTL